MPYTPSAMRPRASFARGTRPWLRLEALDTVIIAMPST
jgi:hypothetical protein